MEHVNVQRAWIHVPEEEKNADTNRKEIKDSIQLIANRLVRTNRLGVVCEDTQHTILFIETVFEYVLQSTILLVKCSLCQRGVSDWSDLVLDKTINTTEQGFDL